MDLRSAVLQNLSAQDDVLGDAAICIAVLDGPADLTHPCFAGADVTRLDTLVDEPAGPGPMSRHGTHVASLLFGQPGSPVVGLAPRCRGLILPVFRDGNDTSVSQLDLAQAIERAVDEGAHIINISGGERSPLGVPDPILERALQMCESRGVLVVSAIGNDGSECLQVPAAAGSVIAVGAVDAEGDPLATNNWADSYRDHGVLAPGAHIEGAAPGGGHASMSGSSFATPAVSGVAALLLDAQLSSGREPNPLVAGAVILDTATPPKSVADSERHPNRVLNAAGAFDLITRGRETVVNIEELQITEPAAGRHQAAEPPAPPDPGVVAAGDVATAHPAPPETTDIAPVPTPSPTLQNNAPTAGVRPAADCQCQSGPAPSLVYAIGTIGFDFRTEARRDSFRQQMDPVSVPDPENPDRTLTAPANPYDPIQLSDYLKRNPWASDKLTWILLMDRTPLYALEAEVPVGMDWGQPVLDPLWNREKIEQVAGQTRSLADVLTSISSFPPVSHVYKIFRDALVGQTEQSGADHISRVSIPGILTNRTVRLFSGQVVRVVEVKSRGIHTWNESALVDAVVREVTADVAPELKPLDEKAQARAQAVLSKTVRALLDKVYYQFRNLGQSPADRALNYAGTNAFMLSSTIKEGLLSGKYVPGEDDSFYTLDTISVSKSPYDRIDSICYDVVATFFDPENDRRARVSYLFTIDVSDELPVSLAPAHRFLGGI